MKYNLQVDWEAMEPLIKTVLKDDMAQLRKDLAYIKKTKKGFVFSLDWEEDVEIINKLLHSMKVVTRYYGG